MDPSVLLSNHRREGDGSDRFEKYEDASSG